MSRRGPYAKGVARREEILESALAVIGEKGFRSTSLKEIAAAVGVTPPALLHYFGTKEELFTAVLRRRDERDIVAIQAQSPALSRAAFVELIRRNTTVPGLIQLFAQLAVDAADPDHPAHAFFMERSAWFRERLVEAIEELPEDQRPAMPAESFARIVQATVDGLQVQWLIDPELDMAATIETLLEALYPALPGDSIP